MIAAANILEHPSGAAVASRLSNVDDSPGKRLKLLREARGLRQEDVARELMLSRAAYCQYETGSSKLRVDMAVTLAAILDSSPEYIAFGTGVRDR